LLGYNLNPLSNTLQNEDLPWLREYKIGTANRLDAIAMSDASHGKTLSDLAREMYILWKGILLIGVLDVEAGHLLISGVHGDSIIQSRSSHPRAFRSVAYIIGKPSEIRLMKSSKDYSVLHPVGRKMNREPRRAASLASNARLAPHPSLAPKVAAVREQPVPSGSPDDKLLGHLIISGYSNHSTQEALLILKLLHEERLAAEYGYFEDVVVLLPSLENTDVEDLKGAFPGARVRSGIALNVEDLVQCGIRQARSLIVLSDPQESDDVNPKSLLDSRPIFTVMLLDQISATCRDDLQVLTFVRDTNSVGLLGIPKSRWQRTRLGAPFGRNLATCSNETEIEEFTTGELELLAKAGGTSEKARDVLQEAEFYQRPRFCFGEFLLPSISAALLAREHQVPGTGAIIRHLLGMDPTNRTLRLRLLGCPPIWNHRCYDKVLDAVLNLGGLVLGLLRCGRGPISIPALSGVRFQSSSGDLTTNPPETPRRHRFRPPPDYVEVKHGLNSLPWYESLLFLWMSHTV